MQKIAWSSRFKPYSSRLFKRDSTLGNLHDKLSLWPLAFLNYTKTSKYEALEKNAFSKP